MFKRLSPRWVVEVVGAAAVAAAAFLVLPALGVFVAGLVLVLEASIGEPLRPPSEES